MTTEHSLQSYARALILRARPDLDHRRVDEYVASADFAKLQAAFDIRIRNVLDEFLLKRGAANVPAPAPAAPAQPAAQKMNFPVLTATPPARSAAPANAPASAAASTPVPPMPPAPPMPAAPPMPPAPPLPPAPPMPSKATVSPAAAAPVSPAADATALPVDTPPASTPAASAPAASPDPVAPAAAAPVPVAPAAAAPQPAAPPARPPAPAAQPALPDLSFRLPNGRAGCAYEHMLEAAGGGDSVVFDSVTLPPGLDLVVDLASGAVKGTPAAAGDYAITVDYHFARESSARRRRAVVQVSITPDPRTMWKNLPTDPSAPYAKEDETCSSLRGPELTIAAASKRGRSHAHVGSFRDDDYRIAHQAASGWYIAAVADGAGSARYSRRGAAIICDEAKTRVLSALNENTCAQLDAAAQAYSDARHGGAAAERQTAAADELHTHLSRIVGNAAYYAARAIHEEVAAHPELGGVFKDYSSTALIAVCKRYPFGTLCAAYWVGDGAVAVYSRSDGVTLLGDVDSGEFSGQTRFLDNAAVDHDMLRKRTRFALVEDMTALVLMTDGVSDAKFETEARLGRDADWHAFWEELDRAAGFGANGPEPERKLLDWLDFWSQGNHDDRTIAVIY